MQVEIWSDVACPWCAVGKRRFEAALRAFGAGSEVHVRWRSFELDPSAPPTTSGDYVARLAAKYGTDDASARQMIDRMTDTAAEDGWRFRFDRIQPGNTFDAHRLLHLAAERGMQDAVKERFLAGYLEEGAAIGLHGPLQGLAVDAGLDGSEVMDVLSGDHFAAEVRAEERQARELGINGVPFFVIDRRLGVSGAQPVPVLTQALEQAWADRSQLAVVGGSHAHDVGQQCADGHCEI